MELREEIYTNIITADNTSDSDNTKDIYEDMHISEDNIKTSGTVDKPAFQTSGTECILHTNMLCIWSDNMTDMVGVSVRLFIFSVPFLNILDFPTPHFAFAI